MNNTRHANIARQTKIIQDIGLGELAATSEVLYWMLSTFQRSRKRPLPKVACLTETPSWFFAIAFAVPSKENVSHGIV